MGHRLARLYVQKRAGETKIYVQGKNPKGQYYMWDVLGPYQVGLAKRDRSNQLLTAVEALVEKSDGVG